MDSLPQHPAEPLILRACRGEPTERTPIWLMRQAGRYMPEYRAVRSKVDFWTLCQSPSLACEVTLQPIDAFGLDAAIVFSDLLVSLPPLGCPVEFGKGHGPIIHNRIDAASDVARLTRFDIPTELGYVADAVGEIVRALPSDVPLIGFAGAAFTLASYLIEGGSSREFMRTKAFLHAEPAAAERLFELLTEISIDLLSLQAEAGCRMLQIFDSWAGCLDPDDYRDWGLRYSRRMVAELRERHPEVPVVVFAKGTGAYLDVVAECGAPVLGVDWPLSLDRARALVGPKVALQGNLDPGRLLGSWESLKPAVDRVLDAAGDGTGHIFNLGHGIHQHTDPQRVRDLVDYVKAESERRR